MTADSDDLPMTPAEAVHTLQDLIVRIVSEALAPYRAATARLEAALENRERVNEERALMNQHLLEQLAELRAVAQEQWALIEELRAKAEPGYKPSQPRKPQ